MAGTQALVTGVCVCVHAYVGEGEQELETQILLPLCIMLSCLFSSYNVLRKMSKANQQQNPGGGQ